MRGIALGMLVFASCGGGGGGKSGGTAPVTQTADSVETLSPFAINSFYLAPEQARNFGIDTAAELEAYVISDRIPYYRDLGASWGRIHPDAFGSFAWGSVDSDRDGQNFDFSYTDAYVRGAQAYGIHLLPSLSPMAPDEWLTASTYVPSDSAAYDRYVRAVVERYDGDGVADMEDLKESICEWQLDNEADLRNRKRDGQFAGFESPSEYLRVLQATFEALRAADPESRLMINLSGVGQGDSAYGIDYLTRLMDAGAGAYFDILSYHVYPDTYDGQPVMDELAAMKSLVGNRPIWITETSIPSGNSSQFRDAASEAEQARWLAKSYSYHTANGVARMFWLNVEDMSPSLGDTLFTTGNLMTFGPPREKKASYHTYQLLATKLTGASTAVAEGTSTHRFDFPDGRRLYVLWGAPSSTIDLSGVYGNTVVTITHIVEDATRSEPVTEQVAASAIPLSESPGIVEQP